MSAETGGVAVGIDCSIKAAALLDDLDAAMLPPDDGFPG
jgi:hypothetical protein